MQGYAMVLKNRSQLRLAVCLVLAALVFVVYARSAGFPFINMDDYTYVLDNPHVQAGITPLSIKWAFTSGYAANWHPLTWLSHMLDWQIWGDNAGGHHLTNILFHAANTILLFLVLSLITGSVWRSALVAALFGVHPLHVESVAWVAERKDVLSTFFFLLTIWAYYRYVQDGRRQSYAMMLIAFTLGLLSKQMVVSLPILLLLLDYWPLKRLGSARDLRRLVLEKLPLFAIAAAGCAATVIAQSRFGTTQDYSRYTLPIRLDNAALSYVVYLAKMVWPSNLAVLYPHPADTIPISAILASVSLIAVACAFAVKMRRHGYLITGWLWYLISLVPVIGIVQLCDQARADRYTYIPSIGILVAVVWGVADMLYVHMAKRKAVRAGIVSAAIGVIILLSAAAFIQIGYWKDSVTMFRHAMQASHGNYLAMTGLGIALHADGNLAEGRECIKKALKERPDNMFAAEVLADMFYDDKLATEAEMAYRHCLDMKNNSAHVHEQLGRLLADKGNLREACKEFATAVRIDPKSYSSRFDYATALDILGKSDEALRQYQAGVDLKPDIPQVHRDMAAIYFKKGDYAAAWREVHLCLKYSGSISPDFMVLLASKMPEPRE